MSERYKRIYMLESSLYADRTPVIISAGALLQDMKTQKLLVQLKLRSITKRQLKSVIVNVYAVDSEGRQCGEIVQHEYTGILVNRDDAFGQKDLIEIPDNDIKAFSAEVIEVVSVEGVVWKSSGKKTEALPKVTKIEKYLKVDELIKQYKIRYGPDADVCPFEYKSIWLCTCGKVNYYNEAVCHACGKRKKDFFPIDIDGLMEESRSRIASEYEAEVKRKKSLKITSAVFIALILLILVTLFGISQYRKNRDMQTKYETAVLALNEEKYEDAISILIELDNYKDSKELAAAAENKLVEIEKNQKLESDYDTAVSLIEDGISMDDYLAYDFFDANRDYKDCADYLKNFKYLNIGYMYTQSENDSPVIKSSVIYDYSKEGKKANKYITDTLMESYTYDENGNLTEVKQADGFDTVYTYYPDGNLQSCISKFARTSDGIYYSTSLSFDENGDLTRKEELSGETAKAVIELEFAKDEKGSIKSFKWKSQKGDSDAEPKSGAFNFNMGEDTVVSLDKEQSASGDLTGNSTGAIFFTCINSENGRKMIYRWVDGDEAVECWSDTLNDSNGNPAEITEYKDNKPMFTETYKNTYDDNNNLISVKSFYEMDSVNYSYEYSYEWRMVYVPDFPEQDEE